MRVLGLLVSLLWLPPAGAEPLLTPEHTQPAHAGYPAETPALQTPQAAQTAPNTSSVPALLQTPETLPAQISPAPVPAAPGPDAYAPASALPQALFLAPGQPIERVVWTKAPIPITLPVGIERMVIFPTTVRFGPSVELAAKLRDPQSLEGTLYLTATEPFPPARALVQECTPSPGVDAESCTPSGRLYILDLQAVAQGASSAPVQVFAPPESAVANSATPSTDAFTVPRGYTPVELVRFAFQQLYAPSRLLRELPGVSRVSLHTRNSVPLYEGGALEAEPEVSWSDGVTYVTAVMLQNRTRVPQTIDPRAIRGQWLSRSLLWGRTRLAPRGDARGADSAPVILVSPRPFAENLRWLIR